MTQSVNNSSPGISIGSILEALTIDLLKSNMNHRSSVLTVSIA